MHLSLLLESLLCLGSVACPNPAQIGLVSPELASQVLLFNKTWYLLGPFRIGTREAVWGADPLEAVGGFVNIVYNESATFRSPLTADAWLTWSSSEFEVKQDNRGASALLHVNHDNVDWTFQQIVYGWAALQYQTWTRGILHNHDSESKKAWLYPEGILEFYLNGRHYFGGDFYTFNRAPVLVDVLPGSNVIDVRLLRDVRAKNGYNPPIIDVAIHVRLAESVPTVHYENLVIPDIVNGKLPSRYFSLSVRNPLSSWITVHQSDTQHSEVDLVSTSGDVRIAPGQVRSLSFRISETWEIASNISDYVRVTVDEVKHGWQDQFILRFSFSLKRRSLVEPSRFTFLHPSGVVSYAVVRPPTVQLTEPVPVLVLLHGAGLEADDYLIRHSLDGMPDMESFALFPTGMSPWSGDDWHTWGNADVLYATEALHDWVQEMSWNGSTPRTDRVIIVGHSNGGQGTWYFATHLPDRTIAAAPSSGWTSIENYVSYTMWREADPLKDNILRTARGSYCHELLLPNLAQIPVLQQHGSVDDIVPAYHSRLMSSLRSELGMPSDYVEFVGKPHYWEGLATTDEFQQFYIHNLQNSDSPLSPSMNFSIIVPGCGSITAKFGIVVDQLESPDRFGRIDVAVIEVNGDIRWHLHTANVHRFHLDLDLNVVSPTHVFLDDSPNPVAAGTMNLSNLSCAKSRHQNWICSKKKWKYLNKRYGRQRGAMDAILQPVGTFQVVDCAGNTGLAVQVSNNLLQYYGVDAGILSCKLYLTALNQSGNVILLAVKQDPVPSQLEDFPITIATGDIHIRSSFTELNHIIKGKPGVGAIFLRPLEDERLELIVWGFDDTGLRHALRLVPTLTGAGQPDFVVLGPNTNVAGHEGALAMGFFDHSWNISKASYLP